MKRILCGLASWDALDDALRAAEPSRGAGHAVLPLGRPGSRGSSCPSGRLHRAGRRRRRTLAGAWPCHGRFGMVLAAPSAIFTAERNRSSIVRQSRACLSELHIGAALVFPKPAARDRKIEPGLVFGRAAFQVVEKTPVDQLDEDAAAPARARCRWRSHRPG
jgi:hypothetical protein